MTPAGEGAPCHVAPLVISDPAHQLLHARQYPAIHANLVPSKISGEREHALHDMVVGHRRTDLRRRRRICGQYSESIGQPIEEDLAVGRKVVEIAVQIVADPDGVEPEPKYLSVLCFLKGELRQVHFVAQPPLGTHRGHERLDILSHRFLARDELRAQPGGIVAFAFGERFPVCPVAREVDTGRVPEFRVTAGE